MTLTDIIDAEIRTGQVVLTRAVAELRGCGLDDTAVLRLLVGEIATTLIRAGHGDLVTPLTALLCDAIVPDEWVEQHRKDSGLE